MVSGLAMNKKIKNKRNIKISRRNALIGGASSILLSSAIAKPAISKGIRRLTMTHTWPKNFPGLGTSPERIAKHINQATDGEIEIKVFAAGELVPAFEALDAASIGVADMYNGAEYYFQGKNIGFNFFTSVPFGMTANELNAWIDHGGGKELWNKLSAQFNVISFQSANTGVQMGGWFNKEITNIDDLKGLKIRMPGLGGEVLRRVGSAAVAIPGGEIYPALQSGAIDATEWVGPWNDLAFAFYQVAKFYYWPGFHEPGAGLVTGVNLDTWNSLTNTQREIFKNVFSHENTYTLAEFNHHNSIALNTLINKHGVQMRSFSKEIMNELKLKSSEVLEDVATKDPISNEIYLSFMDNLKRLRNWSKHSELAYMASRED